MPITTHTTTIKLSTREVAEILAQHVENKISGTVKVSFKCKLDRDQDDPGPGTPLLSHVEIEGVIEVGTD